MGDAVATMIKRIAKSPMASAAAAWLVGLYLRLLDLTTKKTILHRQHFDDALADKRGVIIAFWHGRLCAAPFVRRETGANVNMLISRHRDGALIANAVRGFGISFIRGSARNPAKPGKTKHGASAVAQMLGALERGEIVAITPDGPRGPRETVQAGVIKLAQASGAAIIPAGISATRGTFFNSWDRFLAIWPFAKIIYIASEAIHVPQDATGNAIAQFATQLEQQLAAATEEADRQCGQARAPQAAAA